MPSSLMEKYELLNQIGDGTFGSVAKGISKKNGQLVAIKKMKQKYYTWEECVKLPEVDVVRRIHGHPNIVKLREVIRENNELFFVFEYMDGDVLGVIKKGKQSQRPEDAMSSPAIPYPRVKHFMRQILQALAYIHKRGYFHRDLKPENLLVKKDANGEEIVKLGDFGLVKEVRARPPFTDYVSTRWYRAPELLLQDRAYGTPVDIWAAACIMSELITTRPLFPGANEVDQLFKIMTILGSPTEKMWPGGYALAKKIKYNFPRIKGNGLASVLPKHLPAQALDLMNQMLAYDPAARPTAEQCLQHPYFNVGIDESNAPSSAALSKLMDGAQRLQHSPQSSPAALQGVDVQAKASGQQQVEGPNRTAISSANANFSVSSPSKYYMLPLKTKELAGGAQPVPHGPDHASPKPAEGTTSSKPPADNKNMLYNSKFGKNANHTTSPGEETSAQHYNELGFKGLNLANVRAPYGKGSNSNWQQPSSTQQPQQIKHKPFPTMASPPKKDAPPHRHNSTDVDLDGLMQEFANEVTPMGYSAQKIASPPESSSQRKNDGGASSLLPKQRGSKDLSPRNDPVLALLNNSRYRKSTQPNANDRSHPTQAPHHNNTDHGYPGLGTSGIGANRNPAGARGSMDSGSMPSVGSMPSPLSGQPNVSPSIRAMLAKHRTSGFNFH